MSIKIMSRVWDHSTAKGSKLLVMLALADFANDKGEIFPSLDTIAKKSRLSRRQVIRIIKDLESSKELSVIRGRRKDGKNKVNQYRISPYMGGSDKMSPYTEGGGSEAHDTTLVTPMSPDPSVNRIKDKEEEKNIFELYSENIGSLTPMIGEELQDAEKEYDAAWIPDAFKIAVENNVRKWSYVSAVLEGWKINGRGWSPGKNGKSPQKERESKINSLKGMRGPNG